MTAGVQDLMKNIWLMQMEKWSFHLISEEYSRNFIIKENKEIRNDKSKFRSLSAWWRL